MLKHRLKTLRATVSPVIRSQRPPPSWVEWKWVDKNTRMCQIQSNQRRLSATRCIISSSVSRTIDIRREGTPKLEALQNSGPFGNSQSFHHHVEREFASARQGTPIRVAGSPSIVWLDSCKGDAFERNTQNLFEEETTATAVVRSV